jgi:hypothetical protein
MVLNNFRRFYHYQDHNLIYNFYKQYEVTISRRHILTQLIDCIVSWTFEKNDAVF